MNTKAKKQAIDSVLVHLLDSRQAIKRNHRLFTSPFQDYRVIKRLVSLFYMIFATIR
ncbi:hypothetical protein ACG92U_02215 [Leuconostoc citreum]